MIPIDKKRLIVDFDNVLVDSTQAIVDLYNEDFQYYNGFKAVRACDMHTYGFKELTLASEEYVNHLWNRPRFFSRLKPMPYAREILEVLTIWYGIEVATLGFSPSLKQKSYDINHKFPNIIKKINLINFKEFKDKSHLDMTNAVFIDDQANNLVSSNAVRKICFGDVEEWNSNWSGERCYNWHDVLNALNYTNDESIMELFTLLQTHISKAGMAYANYCMEHKTTEQLRKFTQWSSTVKTKVFQIIFDNIPNMTIADRERVLPFVVEKLSDIHTATDSNNETALFRVLQITVDEIYAKFIKTIRF